MHGGSNQAKKAVVRNSAAVEGCCKGGCCEGAGRRAPGLSHLLLPQNTFTLQNRFFHIHALLHTLKVSIHNSRAYWYTAQGKKSTVDGFEAFTQESIFEKLGKHLAPNGEHLR
eukprot:1160420-Pelagomonas_calceolata.AAC.17